MRIPKDLQAHATKHLRNHFAEALSSPDSFRLDWPLHPPTAATAKRDLPMTQEFIRAWQRWPHQEEIIYESRNWSRTGLGTNSVPVRVVIDGAERIASAAGMATTYSQAVQRAQKIASIFPERSDFAHTVHRAYKQWKDLSAYDLHCLEPCLNWLLTHPDSGEWERAVPVEGVDGKWIGSHRRLLLTLLSPFDITELGLRRSDARIRLRYLNQILYGSDPLEALHQQTTSVPVIIIRNETGQRLALQVDGLAGSRIEMVVKPLGRQVSHIAGISAATIMGDGSVMLILDLIALMRNVGASPQYGDSKPKKSASQKPVVLIIDDSVTVRKVTSRLLERNGYETQTANDGVDALEKLQTLTPDIMLLDIEMPRMDGFEVATQVRHNPRLKDVPIIMITSRTGEKHRERALAIGVTDYMGKPFQEQELLNALAHYTAQA